jgi:preprotein translocase subunit SecG
MFALLLILHVLTCAVLVAIVLLQAGRGGGLATAFGGGGAQSIFGGRGAATFLSKATVVLGGLFFLTSLSLALLSTRSGDRTRSLMQEEARRAAQSAPAPAGTPARPMPGPAATPSTTPGSTPGATPPSGTSPQQGTPAQGGGASTQPAPAGGR